jgi:hypothetical protein
MQKHRKLYKIHWVPSCFEITEFKYLMSFHQGMNPKGLSVCCDKKHKTLWFEDRYRISSNGHLPALCNSAFNLLNLPMELTEGLIWQMSIKTGGEGAPEWSSLHMESSCFKSFLFSVRCNEVH